jgi:hypothetical protein
MRKANIKGALVGVEAVTPEGLKSVFKDFNYKPPTFDATVEMALRAGVTFAQFVMMTPFLGTIDFGRWEKEQAKAPEMVFDIPSPATGWTLLQPLRQTADRRALATSPIARMK